MNLPNDRKYTASHEWLLDLGGGRFRIGLSDYAQTSLGDIVFVDLPAVGDEIKADERMGDVESVKAVSEILSPVSATVVAVNETLGDAPELINSDPNGSWLVEVENVANTAALYDAEEYQVVCEQAEA